ncbi:hypothetical protein EV361DRAFT_368805 [Lentinula raphanica]|nr:hypothetical protein EV361DRAFT_368805 [Lentinula raphanica]
MSRRMSHRSLSRPIWLILAMVYLCVALIDAFPLPTPSSVSPPPGPSKPPAMEVDIPITLGYYSFPSKSFIKWREFKNLRKAVLEAEEKRTKGAQGREEGLHSDPQQVLLQSEVTLSLCIGFEDCWVYQQNLDGASRTKILKTSPQLNREKVTSEQLNEEPKFERGTHRKMKASISDVSGFLNWKESLFKTFSTPASLRSALEFYGIRADISDEGSFYSAMLQLMKHREMIRDYDEDQTLEQNLIHWKKPSWATLRVGFLNVSRLPRTIDMVWQKNGNFVRTEKSETQEPGEDVMTAEDLKYASMTDKDIVAAVEEAARLKVSPEELPELDRMSVSLCLDFFTMCFVLAATGNENQYVVIAKKAMLWSWKGQTRFHRQYYSRLNIRLDEEYVAVKNQTKGYSVEIMEDLKNIEKLEESSHLKITNEESLIHALLIYLQKVGWLPLTLEQLKRNLDKPLQNLLDDKENSDEYTNSPATANKRPISSLDPSHPSAPQSSKKMKQNWRTGEDLTTAKVTRTKKG